MAFEGNKTASDFETMLRRHLEQANQFADACPDFDPEAANAYLEGALSGLMRSAYESHLAGCSSCRHGLVMLSSMTPEVAAPVAGESPVTSWWRSLREAFTLPAWGVGLVAVTSALVLAFGVYALRRPADSSQAGAIAMSTREVSSSPSAQPAGVAGTTPVPSSFGDAIQPSVRSEVHRDSAGERAKEPPRNQNTLPVLTAPPALTDALTAPKPTQAEDLKALQNPATASQVTPVQSETRSREAESKKEETQRQDAFRSAQPSPSQVAETQDRSVNTSAARRLAPGESPPKSKPQATPTPRSSEDENFRPLLRKVRDKSFRFDRGTWIDQEFKPENRLPRTRISRGTSDFDRVLAETPALAPFFDLGAVIVVWQGRVYEVRKW